MTTTTPARPYRVVDSLNHGWVGGANTDRYHGYDPTTQAMDADRFLSDRTLDRIRRDFGQWRPVVPSSDADLAQLDHAFSVAGRSTIVSIAAALDLVSKEARTRFLAAGGGHRDAAAYAERSLIAGQPGSWKSDLLLRVARLGADVTNPEPPIWLKEELAPLPLVDPVPCVAIANVLRRWTANPDSYVEVAETLTYRLSAFADGRLGRRGWTLISGLTPRQSQVISPAYRLLYSQSAYFNPSVV